MQTEEKKLSSRLKKAFTNVFQKNLFITIISVVFALLLWGYVLMDTKPARVKVVEDVMVSFDGEADLLARNLVVSGNRDEILKDVTVRVSTELTSYADLDATDIKATINLRNISKPGEYTVTVSPSSTIGAALSASPSTVLITVDDLVSRRVPVELRYDSTTLPDGYWCADPAINRSEIEISGAKETLARINKAVCVLNLSERTESIHESMTLVMLDENGDEVPSGAILSTLPSVTVDMNIYRAVTLPIDVDSVILGSNSLPENYEITAKSVTPAAIVVTGPDELIDAYTELDIEHIDISGRTSSILTDLAVNVPEGLTILGDSTVSAYINIREARSTVNFYNVPIEVRGLARQFSAALQLDSSTVTVTGPLSVMRALNRGDIALYVDAAELEAGTFLMSIRTETSRAGLAEQLSIQLSFDEVTVIIS